MAGPGASDAGPAWPSLPLGVWAAVACRASSVADAWALTATCRELLALRQHPKLQAWRESQLKPVLYQLAESVHNAGVWVHRIHTGASQLWEGLEDEEYDGVFDEMPPPSQAFLSACVPYGVASLHRCIAGRKFFQDLMGPARRKAMVTKQDRKAEAEIRRLGRGPGWEGFLQDMQCFSPDSESEDSWVVQAVDAIENALELVMKHGIPRDVPVPVPVGPEDAHDYEERLRGGLGHCRLQPLEDWLGRHRRELGAPLVEALKEALPPAPAWWAWGESCYWDGSTSDGSADGNGNDDEDSEDDDR